MFLRQLMVCIVPNLSGVYRGHLLPAVCCCGTLHQPTTLYVHMYSCSCDGKSHAFVLHQGKTYSCALRSSSSHSLTHMWWCWMPHCFPTEQVGCLQCKSTGMTCAHAAGGWRNLRCHSSSSRLASWCVSWGPPVAHCISTHPAHAVTGMAGAPFVCMLRRRRHPQEQQKIGETCLGWKKWELCVCSGGLGLAWPASVLWLWQ